MASFVGSLSLFIRGSTVFQSDIGVGTQIGADLGCQMWELRVYHSCRNIIEMFYVMGDMTIIRGEGNVLEHGTDIRMSCIFYTECHNAPCYYEHGGKCSHCSLVPLPMHLNTYSKKPFSASSNFLSSF